MSDATEVWGLKHDGSVSLFSVPEGRELPVPKQLDPRVCFCRNDSAGHPRHSVLCPKLAGDTKAARVSDREHNAYLRATKYRQARQNRLGGVLPGIPTGDSK